MKVITFLFLIMSSIGFYASASPLCSMVYENHEIELEAGGLNAKLWQAFGNVEVLKKIRNGYTGEVAEIPRTAQRLLKFGLSKHEVAETVSRIRREIGLKYKMMLPAELREDVYRRNIWQYGDPLGPTFENLQAKYRSEGLNEEEIWDRIIEVSSKPNSDVTRLHGQTEAVGH